MPVTTKDTMAMPGVKGIGNETMKVYGQFAMALVAEINAGEIEEQILGRCLTQDEVAALIVAPDGVLTINDASYNLAEARTLRIKAEDKLAAGVAAEIAGE